MSRTAALCILLLLAACEPDKDQPPVPKLFDEQRNALDQTRAVDDTQQKQAEEQRKAIDQQTQ